MKAISYVSRIEHTEANCPMLPESIERNMTSGSIWEWVSPQATHFPLHGPATRI
jgi:hypothetical protein